ncbi:ArgP/LysG family DNA-binding transcriptional regulator, partial [Patulibacter sp. S7RM1-6]
AVRLGLGWGALTPAQLADARAAGDELVELEPGATIEVPLHWQQWRLRTASLDRLAAAVVAAGRAALRP